MEDKKMRKSHQIVTGIFFLLFLTIAFSHAASQGLDYTRSSFDYKGIVAADIDGDGTDEVIVDYGSMGLYVYDFWTHSWTKLHAMDVESVVVGNFDTDATEELVIDFGVPGLYLYDPDQVKWQRITNINPKSVTVFNYDDPTPDDEILVDLGAGNGLYVYDPSTGVWVRFNTNTAQHILAAGFDNGANEELLIDFGPLGLYFWDDAWYKIHTTSPVAMIAADIEGPANYDTDAIIDFGLFVGLYKWDDLPGWPYGNWTKMSPNTPFPEPMEGIFLNPGSIDDEVFVDWGSAGLYWWNTPNNWSRIHTSNPKSINAADLDGGDEELVVDFGTGIGLYVWSWDTTVYTAGWTRLHNFTADIIARAEVNGDGRDDLIIDFGTGVGVYLYYWDPVSVSYKWRRLNYTSP